jgi:DNA repair photolyase/ribosomal protein S27AE
VHGYFAPKQFTSRTNGSDKTDEIALNPDGFVGLTDKDILSILVHEMVHLWQAHFGKPGRRGYHNRGWAQKMVDVGLQPAAADGSGKLTGEAVMHKIVPGGPFEVVVEQLLATGFQLTWQSIADSDDILQEEDGPHYTRISKVRYTCPQCGQTRAWAKPRSRLLCNQCIYTHVKHAVEPIAPAKFLDLLSQFEMRPLVFPDAIGRQRKERPGNQPGVTVSPVAQPKTDQLADYRTTYSRIHGIEPPATIAWETSTADIISPGRGFMAGVDFTMQLQVGCLPGCHFCYVATAARLAPREVRGNQGENWGFLVRIKEKAIEKLKKHLASGELADRTIYWSGITDPYTSTPKITHAVWEACLQTPQELRPRRIIVQTRFRPDRDVALMQQYNETTIASDGGPPLLVSYSIGTDHNELIAAWEKATPRFEQRMHAIHTLRQADIFVVATLSPLGLWTDLPSTLEQFRAWDVAYLTCLVFKEHTSSANTPPQFLSYLREHYPLVLDPAWQAEQIQIMQAIYGSSRVLVGKPGFDSLAQPHTV